MPAIKAFLVLTILTGVIAAGIVYNIYSQDGFRIDMKILDARLDGDDIIASVELRFVNDFDDNVRVTSAKIQVMNPDKTVIFVSEYIAPPAILVLAKGTTTYVVNDVRITNVNSLGSSVIVIVDASWQVGPDVFSVHREVPVSLSSYLS